MRVPIYKLYNDKHEFVPSGRMSHSEEMCDQIMLAHDNSLKLCGRPRDDFGLHTGRRWVLTLKVTSNEHADTLVSRAQNAFGIPGVEVHVSIKQEEP